MTKPVLIFDQQQSGLESNLLTRAIEATFEGLVSANELQRKPAPISRLTIGLKCGGSDGFSGLSANPTLGRVSDMLVALGGSSILSEFPELCGVEQNLIDRCVDPNDADRFIQLMRNYNARAKAVNSGFEMNPSPGNIQDGLITDAMKSAGAARKSGTSPVCGVLDYPEYVTAAGLNLLCTPAATSRPSPRRWERAQISSSSPLASALPPEIPSPPSSKSLPTHRSPNACPTSSTSTLEPSFAARRPSKKSPTLCWTRFSTSPAESRSRRPKN